MPRFVKILLAVVAVLAIVYLLGPAPAKPVFAPNLPNVPAGASALSSYVAAQDAGRKIKPNNEARIVWYNDSLQQPTDYAIVYLHGFSASQEEGNPTHRDIARQFGCNLYLSRLHEHGIDTTEQLVNYTADGLWETSKQALAIGKQLGKRVILMGTSTGGSVALHLAAAFPNDVAGLVLISPNIEINDANAWLLNNHWGKQIATLVLGSPYRKGTDTDTPSLQYWNNTYRVEALVALQEYVETAMVPATFEKVKQPTLALAYYKNDTAQDKTVKVSAIRTMMTHLGTPANKKHLAEMPNTGDHVQGSPIKSKDVDGVKREIAGFLEKTMGLKAIN
jgi:pimeloyl-ACP methyl ester carboxylesterase